MRKLQALTVAPCILDDGNVAEVGDIFRKAIQGKGNNTHTRKESKGQLQQEITAD